MTAPHKVAFPARCAVNICYDKHLCSQVFPAGIPVEGFFEGMVELFDADLKRKGFDGVALPAGSYELHKINGVRLDINKSLDELGVQDGDTLVLVPRVAGESFEPQYESLSTGLAAMGKWLGRDGGDRMFAPVTSLTAAHTAMAIIAMAVGVVLALTLRTRTITDSPVPAAMAGGIGVLLVIGRARGGSCADRARGGGSGCDHDRRGDPQAVADRSGHRGGNGVRDPCRCRRRPNV